MRLLVVGLDIVPIKLIIVEHSCESVYATYFEFLIHYALG